MSLSESDLRKKLGKRLRRVVTDDEWVYLDESGHVDDALCYADEDAQLDFLREALRPVEGKLAARSGRTRPKRLSEGSLRPDGRLRALTRINAAKAGKRDDVLAFRREVLRGRLVKRDRVEAWLKRREAEQKSATVYGRNVRIGPDDRPLLDTPVKDWDVPAIAGPTSTGTRFKVNADGPLGRLKALCGVLSRDFGWSEWQGVLFVLTGAPPPASRASYSAVQGFGGAPDRITLDIVATTPAAAVKRLYERARRALQKKPGQALQDKHAELAAYVAGVNDGRTWEDAQESFNRAHPEWAYDDVHPFRRDARQAYKRVTGTPLEWASVRGT